jgi:hypothetical protein
MPNVERKTNNKQITEGEETERQRIQLDFSPEAYKRLLELRTRSEARTNAEVVRNALRLYYWFLEQKENGYTFVLKNGDTVKEVEIML